MLKAREEKRKHRPSGDSQESKKDLSIARTKKRSDGSHNKLNKRSDQVAGPLSAAAAAQSSSSAVSGNWKNLAKVS